MRILQPFDPWKSKLCTCPPKLSFNPYTGCAHRCLYCYATYIQRFWEVREKRDLLRRLEKDLERLESGVLISMSNSSDPYPPAEKTKELTRKCLQLMKEHSVRVLVVTKSNIVVRDVDLLAEMRAAVAITITGRTARQLELNAPPMEKRIEALKILHDAGVPTILRLDPLLPWASKEEWLEVLKACSFVDHVVTSTLKLKMDGYGRIVLHFPQLKEKLDELYFRKGEKVGSYFYLPEELRMSMLGMVEEKCHELGISCAFCREGVPFKARSCDGSHLIR